MWIIWFIFFAALFSFGYAAINGAPWVPTRKYGIDRFLKVADLNENDVLFELGCGDGRLLISAVNKSRCRGVGVELAWPLVLVAWLRAKISRTPVKIRFANAFNTELKDATVVYMFLMPEFYKKIEPVLKKKLSPGTKVISYVWPIPNWTPILVDKEAQKEAFYVYKV